MPNENPVFHSIPRGQVEEMLDIKVYKGVSGAMSYYFCYIFKKLKLFVAIEFQK